MVAAALRWALTLLENTMLDNPTSITRRPMATTSSTIVNALFFLFVTNDHH